MRAGLATARVQGHTSSRTSQCSEFLETSDLPPRTAS